MKEKKAKQQQVKQATGRKRGKKSPRRWSQKQEHGAILNLRRRIGMDERGHLLLTAEEREQRQVN